MPKVTYTPTQKIAILKKVQAYMDRGLTVNEAVKRVGLAINTYYKWLKEYGPQMEALESTNKADRIYRETSAVITDVRDISVILLERIKDEVQVPKLDQGNIRALAQAAQAVSALGRLALELAAVEAQNASAIPETAEEVRKRLEQVREQMRKIYNVPVS